MLQGGRQALILDRASGEYEVVKLGDTIHGLRVVEIEEDQIVLVTPTPPERYFVLPLIEPVPAQKPAAGTPEGAAPAFPGEPPASKDPTPGGPTGFSEPEAGAGPDSSGIDASGNDASGIEDGDVPSTLEPNPDGDDVGDVAPVDGSEVRPENHVEKDVEGGAGGGVMDPYATDPPSESQDSSMLDPYGSDPGSDIPSVIAPPASRAEPDPRTPPAAPKTPKSEPRPPKKDLSAPPPAPPDFDDEFDVEPELDPGPGAGPREETDATPVEPDPDRRDSKVTTVEPTEVQPGARNQAPAASKEQARPLSRRDLDSALADFSSLARQLQIERAQGGGVRIIEIERGSFFAQLGLQRGDVVKRVAGHEVDTVDEAADAYAALARAKHVLVEIERRGAPVRIRYRLTR
ncbi:MAG TPA: hypothetical protein VNO33_07180 [Kofleriaceae bacterium]|nr:hypothetical protein [Kofleriaceae bacterium]